MHMPERLPPAANPPSALALAAQHNSQKKTPMSVRRPIMDRLRSLSAPPAKPHGTLALADLFVRGLAEVANGEIITCTVERQCRTRVFDFPRARPTEAVRRYTIYRSNSAHASLVCDLRAYFEQPGSPH